jgi:hypothetical protein
LPNSQNQNFITYTGTVNAQARVWQSVHTTSKQAHSYFLKGSEVYRSFIEMEHNTYKDGKINKLQKELIAIGISITQNVNNVWNSVSKKHLKMALPRERSWKQ